jgi:signal peptidase
VSRLLKNLLLVLVCLAVLVPAALLVSGKLPYEVFIVHTGSMTPKIPSRSAVIVKKGVYHLGQVISFETPSGVVTHRLIKRTAADTLVTKGDANKTADPWTTTPAQVIGGVVAAPRMLGYWLQYLKDPAGLASLLMLIVCFWLIYSITVAIAQRSQLPQLVPAPAAESHPAASFLRPGVPLSLFADPGRERRLDVGAPIFPGLDADVARVVGHERLAAVWKPALSDPPVVFCCGHCGATFTNTDELRAHAAIHRGPRVQVRQPILSAS